MTLASDYGILPYLIVFILVVPFALALLIVVAFLTILYGRRISRSRQERHTKQHGFQVVVKDDHDTTGGK